MWCAGSLGSKLILEQTHHLRPAIRWIMCFAFGAIKGFASGLPMTPVSGVPPSFPEGAATAAAREPEGGRRPGPLG